PLLGLVPAGRVLTLVDDGQRLGVLDLALEQALGVDVAVVAEARLVVASRADLELDRLAAGGTGVAQRVVQLAVDDVQLVDDGRVRVDTVGTAAAVLAEDLVDAVGLLEGNAADGPVDIKPFGHRW